jgi:hypothetical protein
LVSGHLIENIGKIVTPVSIGWCLTYQIVQYCNPALVVVESGGDIFLQVGNIAHGLERQCEILVPLCVAGAGGDQFLAKIERLRKALARLLEFVQGLICRSDCMIRPGKIIFGDKVATI